MEKLQNIVSQRSAKRLVKQTSVQHLMVFFYKMTQVIKATRSNNIQHRTSCSTAAPSDRTSGNKETHWLVVRVVSILTFSSSLWYCLSNALPYPGVPGSIGVGGRQIFGRSPKPRAAKRPKPRLKSLWHSGYNKALASRRLDRRVPMFLSSHREIKFKQNTHTSTKKDAETILLTSWTSG